ncbi:hypothetical protein PGUG_03361 [Meyerozyma guilliermondii ATCC 6260]|uniref:LAA1-like C-terminal TPR repeats domain-containing protein n=1 Tax=Meyerozyma guilliermondii (strain ATCC 6260 / CBS 566 / DSM 6381 / JCM 1539 / NBRC 10279 / NRRL Y-324) TaxID=294746 RepID=A5DJB0_PICGU|nr:uncharacterized protein PGUG_03361 [Meyerozyma guilliermondii ATCC 6260]EDK39263.2 hypothetical protein PGUG_03361 [Meyerozyma guilliermondii ATCC 6260]
MDYQSLDLSDHSQVYNYLTSLNLVLSNPQDQIEFQVQLDQLDAIFKSLEESDKQEQKHGSLAVSKMLARNLVVVLSELPSKVYDYTNGLLNYINLNDSGTLAVSSTAAIILLTDIFESFPASLTSLINFSATSIYKILKKNPTISPHLVNLLCVVTKHATKSDLDVKFQAKLLKIATKALTSQSVADNTTTVSIKKSYTLLLKNLLILSVTTNYETSLAMSVSGSSKLKAESIMSTQHQFQLTLLETHKKTIQLGFTNYYKEIRIATVELLAHLLLSLVDTGKFSPVEYLVGEYPLPKLNTWHPSLNHEVDLDGEKVHGLRKDKNSLLARNSESIIDDDISLGLLGAGYVETLIFFVQLQQFQNSDYVSTNIIAILDAVLSKFRCLNDVPNHIQDKQWNTVLDHWLRVIDFVHGESGSTSQDLFMRYVFQKFSMESIEETSKSEPKKEGARFTLMRSKTVSKSKKRDESESGILPFHNPYTCRLLLYIIELLIPFGVNFNSLVQSPDQAEEEQLTKNSFLNDLLFKLIINSNDYIRTYSLSTLLKYGATNEVEINPLVLRSFEGLTHEFSALDTPSTHETASDEKDNVTRSLSIKILSYSLFLSSLIKQTDSTLLSNSVVAKMLGFCTQNLKQNTTSSKKNILKNSSCWILLTSLVTLYKDSEFVKLNSSQFLVFWKSLLTSQFMGLSKDESDGPETQKEVLGNLRLRIHSLGCLLNYIDSAELTPESLKNLHFLLTKSYNYLAYLESNLGDIGAVTNFSSTEFQESNYNPNLVSNTLFSNHLLLETASIENVFVSLILYSKKILLRCFNKLLPLLKNDVNSSMVVFLIRVFSDTKIFSRIQNIESREKSKSKSRQDRRTIQDKEPSFVPLSEEYNYSFGVTSKLRPFTPHLDMILLPNDKDSRPLLESSSYDILDWIDKLELNVWKSVDNSVNYDPSVFLHGDYSAQEQFSTNLLTSLVDYSIELLQSVFPQLSLKIQHSLLEQIRGFITAKDVDGLRSRAASINTVVALHGLAANYFDKGKKLDGRLADAIVQICEVVNTEDPSMLSLITETIGLAVSISVTQKTEELIAKYIKVIVNDNDPIARARSLLILSKIYQFTGRQFSDVYGVVSQLLNDPHPIINHFSLKSLVILSSGRDLRSRNTEILHQLHECFIKDDFNNTSSKATSNMRYRFPSVHLAANICEQIVTSFGPGLHELASDSKDRLVSLVVSIRHGINVASQPDAIKTTSNFLSLLSELVIFDHNFLYKELSFFTNFLNLIIARNLKTGVATTPLTSFSEEALFSCTTSKALYEKACGCYVQLFKIHGIKSLSKETVKLLWISMNCFACDDLKLLTKLWVESSSDIDWFAVLNSLFRYSSKKLQGSFMEINYHQKLLPLSQRQKKANQHVEFRDEEIENIVAEGDEDAEKSEPISWEFRLHIFELLNQVLLQAKTDDKLLNNLKSRIQDLIKISFFGSTAPTSDMRLKGIELLDRTLKLFGHMADPLYPTVSILEQQQAQIISALMPCFSADSDSKVLSEAINVSSKFINLPLIKFYSKKRILNTLISLLEEISSNKFIRFTFLENISEYGRKSIQLSILNCWAHLQINSEEVNDAEGSELKEILEKYSSILVPLWILILKEYSQIKHSEHASKELALYNNYWINFISVLSLQLESNSSKMNEYLGENESNFFFILFSLSVETLVRNQNVSEILLCLTRLFKNSKLVELLFDNEIFCEFIDLIDRLILIDQGVEVECEISEMIYTIFQSYLNTNTDPEEGLNKLFELLRVSILPLFNILPFLRNDFDVEDPNTRMRLKKYDSGPSLIITGTFLQKVVEMISKFPDMIKKDLYSCLLFIFAKIYEQKNPLLIAVVLPHLKSVIVEVMKISDEMVKSFYYAIHDYYNFESDNNVWVLSALVLITTGEVEHNEQESILVANSLCNMIDEDEHTTLAVQAIKSLVSTPACQNSLVLKNIIQTLLLKLWNDEEAVSKRKLPMELLLVYAKEQKREPNKLKIFYGLLVPLLLKFANTELKSYVKERLMVLLNMDADAFKQAIGSLSEQQRQAAESLLVYNANGNSADSVNEIELKTFGQA